MEHDLKILPEYFAGVEDMTKPFEVRSDDRTFAVGDLLVLREWRYWSPTAPEIEQGYTGRVVRRRVTYVLRDTLYVKEGSVVLGIEPIPTQLSAEERQELETLRAEKAHLLTELQTAQADITRLQTHAAILANRVDHWTRVGQDVGGYYNGS